MKMTQEQLNTQIAEIVKSEAGSVVKEVVEEAIAKAFAAEKSTGQTVAEKQALDARQAIVQATQGKSEIGQRTREKGEALGAVVRALRKGRNDIEQAALALKKEGNKDLAEMLLADGQYVGGDGEKAMMAGDPETGGILIPTAVSQEIIDILRARVIVRRLGPVTLPMPNGNFRLPKKTQASQGYYVGESTSPTVSKIKMGSVLLSFKKLVTVVPASNDLFRFSSPGADQLIRNDIVDSMAVREDQAFLRDPGTDATPRGLRYWAPDTNVLLGTGGVGGDANIAAITTTLSKLILLLISNNVPMIKPAWIMSPRTYMNLSITRTTNGPYAWREELLRGTLWGWPVVYSTTVPNTLTEGANSDTSELYLVDMADVVIGDSERLMIDASQEAAYEDSGTVKAAFTRDETVIRAISEHDLVVRRQESIAVAKGLRWGV